MPEYLKLAAAFTIGLGAGILASKRFFQMKYENISNEEIESVKSLYSERYGHIKERTSIDDEEIREKAEAEVKSDILVKSSLNIIDDVDAYEQKLAEMEHPEDDIAEEPYLISEEDFSETNIYYEKRTLHYYMDDDVLIDAVTGDAQFVGESFPQVLLDAVRISEDPELYFRYDPSDIDYEILRMKGSYYVDE